MKGKNLSADYLCSLVKEHFGQVRKHRTGIGNIKISMADALMSGLAVFALKKPSLLSFEDSIGADTPLGESLRNLFFINTHCAEYTAASYTRPCLCQRYAESLQKNLR